MKRFIFYGLTVIVLAFSTAVFCEDFKSSTKVLELNERFLEVKNEGLWLVEFYAPWCGHCKQLQPIWDQVGFTLEDSPVRVGRIDCTRFTSVATELNVRGYPTILFFRNGEVYSYDGDRTKEAIVDFALKSSGPSVRAIKSKVKFQEVYKEHSVKGFFLLVINPDDTDNELKKQYIEAANQLFTKAYFYEIDPAILPDDYISVPTIPALLVVKDKSYSFYDPKLHSNVSLWANTERWPLFPLVTYGNLYDMGLCCNRLLALVVSDLVQRNKAGSSTKMFEEVVMQTAKNYKNVLHDSVQFGWLDGPDIANSIALGGMAPPGLLVLNASTYHFYLPEDDPTRMTPESLLLFLQSVIQGKVMPLGGKSVYQKFKRAFYELTTTIYTMFANQPLLCVCLFGLPLGILSIICYTLCTADISENREDYIPDTDESEGDETHDKVE